MKNFNKNGKQYQTQTKGDAIGCTKFNKLNQDTFTFDFRFKCDIFMQDEGIQDCNNIGQNRRHHVGNISGCMYI